MRRKAYVVTNQNGQSVRVTLGAKGKFAAQIAEPSGILAFNHHGLDPESQKAFSEWKHKLMSESIESNR